jgi:hypothetical protein
LALSCLSQQAIFPSASFLQQQHSFLGSEGAGSAANAAVENVSASAPTIVFIIMDVLQNKNGLNRLGFNPIAAVE